MEAERNFLPLAVILCLLSFVTLVYTYESTPNGFLSISGLVSSGEANLTIETQAVVNFTTRAINWGSGKVNQASSSASLTTFETNNVTGGNWTLTTSGGLKIENIGNVNVSLNLSVGKNASEFIGGTNPAYEWNLSNSEASSCTNAAGTGNAPRMNVFYQANTTLSTNGGGLGCSVFRFETGNDEVRIDFNLTIPEDSYTGALGDVITATITAL